MLVAAAVASAALFGGLASAIGSATVHNLCPKDVYLANTPSDDGVHTTISRTLASGDSYTQPYTQLNNGMGWSLKLGFLPGLMLGEIMQYEYTYMGDGNVWFDLSKVDGNPFGWFWNITASSEDCEVSQKAYLFSTDDAAGMQPRCDPDTDVTVILCQWPSLKIAQENGGTFLPDSPPPATTAPPAPPAETPAAAPTTDSPPPADASPLHESFFQHNNIAATPSPSPSPSSSSTPPPPPPPPSTTLATTTSAAAAPVVAPDGNVEVVWFTDVVVEHVTLTTTAVAEASPWAKRHEHHVHAHAHRAHH